MFLWPMVVFCVYKSRMMKWLNYWIQFGTLLKKYISVNSDWWTVSEALDGCRSWSPEPCKDIIQVLDIIPCHCFAMGTNTLTSFVLKPVRSFNLWSYPLPMRRHMFFPFCISPPLCLSLKKQMEKKISDMFSCKDDFCFVSIHLFQLLIPHSEP